MSQGLPFVALWQDRREDGDASLRLLSPEGDLTVALPNMDTSPRAVEEFLPELARFAPGTEARWLLLLEPSLPEAWPHLNWESLTLLGRPLGDQALIVRLASWGPPSTVNSGIGEARLLDMFPQAEHNFVAALQPWFRQGRLRKSRSAQLRKQMETTGELFIVAHGKATGLVDEAGKAFDIPAAHPMPARIWLLACNVNGAMDRLAHRLLEMGCRTVIAARGDLSAPQMEGLVNRWCADGHDDPAAWLARHPADVDGDARSLTVWGEVSLDTSPSATWNRLAWDAVHGEHAQLPLDDETTTEEFLVALDVGNSPATWGVTGECMRPPLLWLAEKHHHPAMDDLKRRIALQDTPAATHALAVAARRAGNYEQMAKYLSRGLGMTGLLAHHRSEHLGALANLFIDLDLPAAATIAIADHEDCLLEDPGDSDWADFKRLDWMARVAARAGRHGVAFDHLAAKRRRPQSDGTRELAGMLYLGAWARLSGAVCASSLDVLADEAMHCLSSYSHEDFGHGNESGAYLLRSLAAHAWATRDPGAVAAVVRWDSLAKQRMITEDPGPWAYVRIFLYLMNQVGKDEFERAIGALERGRYYFEAALFLGFAGEMQLGSKQLDRFQKRRNPTVAALDGNAAGGYAHCAQAENIKRSQLELVALGDLAAMVRTGVLPL
jgi:hypothetical protein